MRYWMASTSATNGALAATVRTRPACNSVNPAPGMDGTADWATCVRTTLSSLSLVAKYSNATACM